MNNRFSKNDILIDLTSLLDIVFIVLLIVMCGQQLLSDETKKAEATAVEKAEQAEKMLDEADAALRESEALADYYEKHIDAFENSEQYVRFIDVVSYYDSSVRLTDRTILVTAGLNDGNEVKRIELTPANEGDAYAELQQFLTEAIEGAAGGEARVPVILSLNSGDEKILYRDEVAIGNIFKELADTHDSVFVR